MCVCLCVSVSVCVPYYCCSVCCEAIKQTTTNNCKPFPRICHWQALVVDSEVVRRARACLRSLVDTWVSCSPAVVDVLASQLSSAQLSLEGRAAVETLASPKPVRRSPFALTGNSWTDSLLLMMLVMLCLSYCFTAHAKISFGYSSTLLLQYTCAPNCPPSLSRVAQICVYKVFTSALLSSRPLRCLYVRFIVVTSSSAFTSFHFVAVDLFLSMVPEPHTAVPFHAVPSPLSSQ